MHNRNSTLKTLFVGGVFFLIPIIVVFVVLEKATRILHQIIAPLAERLPIESVIGLSAPRFMAVILLFVFCLLAGLFARTAAAKSIIRWLETTLLGNLPGYTFMKSLGEDMVGATQGTARQTVLARIEDAWQLAFLVERIEGGYVAVYVPGAPSPWSGSVYFMTEDRIRVIDVPAAAALKCIKQLGVDANGLLKDQLPKI